MHFRPTCGINCLEKTHFFLHFLLDKNIVFFNVNSTEYIECLISELVVCFNVFSYSLINVNDRTDRSNTEQNTKKIMQKRLLYISTYLPFYDLFALERIEVVQKYIKMDFTKKTDIILSLEKLI